MITYQEEKFKDLLTEIKPLLELHWNELANNKDTRPLNVDYKSYNRLNRAGLWKVFTVRDQGVLIGYSSFIIGFNLHYKNWKYATNDVYWLSPSYRGTGVGKTMFEEMEKWLIKQGVKSMVIQEKIDHSHEKLFNSLGYTLIERNYEKVF